MLSVVNTAIFDPINERRISSITTVYNVNPVPAKIKKLRANVYMRVVLEFRL